MNHQEQLLPYYQQELTYLREMGRDFAQRYPALASRLDLESHERSDPHVERLIESFAFLTGRIQYNLDSEFPEIPSALFGLLYPHLQAPMPSMAIAQFEVDPAQAKLTSGFPIAKETALFAQMENDETCWFRTCYPTTLWPLSVMAAKFMAATPHGPLLWLRLESHGVTPAELALDRLRFHLNGSDSLVNQLVELLLFQTQAVHLLPAPLAGAGLGMAQPNVRLTEASRLPLGSIAPIGFGLDEAVLPHPTHVHPAYRLLQEYFAFPKKFHFCEIRNLDMSQLGLLCTLGPSYLRALSRGQLAPADLQRVFQRHRVPLPETFTLVPDEEVEQAWLVMQGELPIYQLRSTGMGIQVYRAKQIESNAFDLWFRFDPETFHEHPQLAKELLQINRDTFRLGCTPIINLFEKTVEPIRLDHHQIEYLLVPDAQHHDHTEIHTVQKVVAYGHYNQEEREILPYYSLNHTQAQRNQKAFWYGRRLPTHHRHGAGTEMWLSFVDLALNPSQPNAETVYAHALCTNRHLAEHVPSGAVLQTELVAPLYQITCLDKPTHQITPPLHGATLWRLVSNLSLNHLSLGNRSHFGLDKRHRQSLGNRHLSTAVRQRFADHGIFLSDTITIAENKASLGWILTDQITERRFEIDEEDGQLRVASGQDGLAALQELLTLYSFANPMTARAQVQSMESLQTRRVMRRMTGTWHDFYRGMEIVLTFDEANDANHSAPLLASVLDHFFAHYASMNTFTQLVVKRKEREGTWLSFPPRLGELHLL